MLFQLKSFVSLRLLKQFLLCFCISVLTFNLVMLFHLGWENWFTAPQTVVQNLYASRFGGTKHFLNGEVYLDAQALQIYAAALIAYFFGIIRTKMGEKVIAFTAFALFVWLLSLTVTKSSILSFLGGFVIFNLYFFMKTFRMAALDVYRGNSACWNKRIYFSSGEFRSKVDTVETGD